MTILVKLADSRFVLAGTVILLWLGISGLASAQTANGNKIQFPNNDYWLVRNPNGSEICQGEGNFLSAGNHSGCNSLSHGTYSAQNLTTGTAAVDVVIGGVSDVPIANGNKIQFPNNNYWLVRDSSGSEMCQGEGSYLSAGNHNGCNSLSPGTYTAQNLTAGTGAVDIVIGGGSDVPIANGNKIQFPNNDYWLVRNPNGSEICQGEGNYLSAGNHSGCDSLLPGIYTAQNLTAGSGAVDVTIAGNDGLGMSITASTVPSSPAIAVTWTGSTNAILTRRHLGCGSMCYADVGSVEGGLFYDHGVTEGTGYQYEATSPNGTKSGFSVTTRMAPAPFLGYQHSGNFANLQHVSGTRDVTFGPLQEPTGQVGQILPAEYTINGVMRVTGPCLEDNPTVTPGTEWQVCEGYSLPWLSGQQYVDRAVPDGTYKYSITIRSISPSGEIIFARHLTQSVTVDSDAPHDFQRGHCSGCQPERGLSWEDRQKGFYARNNRGVFFKGENTPSTSLNYGFNEDQSEIQLPDMRFVVDHGSDTSKYDSGPGSGGNGGDDGTGRGSAGDANFRVACQWSHLAKDDSIAEKVKNKPGAAHLHMFWGNTTTDAFTNNRPGDPIGSRGGGTCSGGALNRSAYWMPALIHDPTYSVLAPKEIIIYYKTKTVCEDHEGETAAIGGNASCTKKKNGDDAYNVDGRYVSHTASDVEEMPQGLKLIAGNDNHNNLNLFGHENYKTPERSDRHEFGQDIDLKNFLFWSCGTNDGDPGNKSTHIPDCLQYYKDRGSRNEKDKVLNATIYFPQCWDGDTAYATKNHVPSVIHRPVEVYCPDTHPKRLPQLAFLIYWDLSELDHSIDGLRLSSDQKYDAFTESDDKSRFFKRNVKYVDRDSKKEVVQENVVHRPGGTLHGDWIAGWKENVMKTWIKNCLKDERNCTFGQTSTRYGLKEFDNKSYSNLVNNVGPNNELQNSDHYPGHYPDGPTFYHGEGSYLVGVTHDALIPPILGEEPSTDEGGVGGTAVGTVRSRVCTDPNQHCDGGGFDFIPDREYISPTAIPEVPSAISPLNGVELTPNADFPVSFSDSPTADRYIVQRFDRTIAKWSYSQTFMAEDICSGGTCTSVVPGVPTQKNSGWRVAALNQIGRVFMQPILVDVVDPDLEVPVAPVQISPINRADVEPDTDVTVTFQAIAGQAVTQYQVQRFDRVAGRWSFNELHSADICSGSTCSVTVVGVPVAINHAWRVRGYNFRGWGAFTQAYFDAVPASLSAVPSAPVLTSPINRADVAPNSGFTATFQAIAGQAIIQYQVQRFDRVARRWSYNEIHTADICNGSTCSVTVAGVPVDVNHAWRVRAYNALGWGAFSQAYFDAVPASLTNPTAVTAISPINREVKAADEVVDVVFTPLQDQYIDRYQVLSFDRTVGKWTGNKVFTASDICNVDRCTASIPGVPVQYNAAWRVRGYNLLGWGAWSPITYYDVQELSSERERAMRNAMDALESYASEYGTFQVANGGWRGGGSGWFFYGGNNYPTSVSDALASAGHSVSETDPLYVNSGSTQGDFLIYQCKTRVGLFSRHGTDQESTSAADKSWWDTNGCPRHPVDSLNANYFILSQ